MIISFQVKDGVAGQWDLREIPEVSSQPSPTPLHCNTTPCPMSLAKKVKGLSVHGCWGSFFPAGKVGLTKTF